MILTLVGLSRGMVEGAANRSRSVGFDITIRPPGTSVIGMSSAPMPEKMIDFARKFPHVTMATGVMVHPVGGLDTISGINYDEFKRMSGGYRFLSGGPFEKPDDILIDEYYAQQKNLKVGDRLKLANHDWTVRGIFESGKLARTVVQLPVLQELTANTGKISFIYVKVDKRSNVRAVLDQLKAKLPDYPIYDMEEFLSQLSVNRVPGLSQFTKVIVALSVIFGFLVVFLAMYTAVLERTREIGILKALGATPAYVLNVLLRETVILALIGSVIGVILTYGTRWAIMTYYPATLTQVIVPDWWPIAAMIAILGALMGASYPGLKAAKQDAVEALAYE
jgi:putative ABC transport system permease protein